MIIFNSCYKIPDTYINVKQLKKRCNNSSIRNFELNQMYMQSNANINFAGHKIKKKLANEERLLKLEKDLPPIQSAFDYLNVLEDVYNSKILCGEPFWRKKSDFAVCDHIPVKYVGLLPYCGVNDVSWDINSYLSGRIDYSKPESLDTKKYIPTHDSIKSVVRVLDYSLNELDKDYGKYKGLVFRKGYMAEHSGQFISSSTNPGIAANFNGYNDKTDYSIIETKSGHKIYEFQKLIHNAYETREKEVLLPRKSKYELISPECYDKKITDAVNIFALELSVASKSKDAYTSKPLSYESAVKKIKVYKEI